jgi:methanogenic corrinoid protein MtbC1
MTALIAQGISAAEAAGRAIADEPGVETVERPVLDDLATRLERSLDAFDGEGAHAAFDRLLASVSVEALLEQVVLPYLHRLGERWERGEVSVAQEHFASNLLRGRLLGLARGWAEGSGSPLVLACPPGEEHDLPLIMFGIVASRRGRSIVFLGTDTPVETLGDVVARTRPAGVVLAASRTEDLRAHGLALRALADSVPLMVAGAGATPETAEEIGARLLVGDPVEAARSLAAEPAGG